MSYPRVIPKDLFNEAKLLKCIGRFALKIHNCEISGVNMTIEDNEEYFKIEQNPLTAELYISNLFISDKDGEEIYLYTKYNSKENYPLLMFYKKNEYYVFDETGNLLIDKHIFKGK
jgi:hypothetical protein